MADNSILHMLTPLKHVSPFDVNMAIDAGYETVVPYTGVRAREVTGLVQDAMFSRNPLAAKATGMFFGGKQAGRLSTCSMPRRKPGAAVRACPIFADPAGSFTTAAAMVAGVEKRLRDKTRRRLVRSPRRGVRRHRRGRLRRRR